MPATATLDQPLREATASKEPSSTPRTTFLATLPTLRQGASGGEVLALQIGLRMRGATYLQGTGTFGPLTDKAVRSFQRQRGLAVDGIVGPRTWDALVIGSSGGAPFALENPQISPGQVWPVDGNGQSRYGYLELGLRSLPRWVEWLPEQGSFPERYVGSEVTAVREIQRRAGLRPSGILGARTTRVMLVINTVVGGFGN